MAGASRRSKPIFRAIETPLKRQFATLAAGFTIALDDFGIGYSSLNYLRHFEFDRIKIDRSFIQNLDTNTDGAAIIKSIVSLGKAMRLTVAAEGVETIDQMHFLSTIGCNELQGYLFSRPIPGNQIDEWLSLHTQLHPPATHEARAA